MKKLTIIDKDYKKWVKELGSRYRQAQIRAAVKVNHEALHYYWELGRDIVEIAAEKRWGSHFLRNLSMDLKELNPEATCFSETNLLYMKNFYRLYNASIPMTPQVEEQFTPQLGEQLVRPLETRILADICAIPWGHHKVLIDKFLHSPEQALFYVRKTIELGWSRGMLLNFIDTNLYEREGKAITNFAVTLPKEASDLAQELTRDPYDFAFAGITGKYNERILKDALLSNITKFLVELGTGFAYVGREYRLEIGKTENFIDLLFYNLRLRCYVVIEVKVNKFVAGDIGQLGSYVVACNHLLRDKERDNPTIGLLICKSKDNTLARYALESTSQPLGISEYDLEKFYPEKIEGTIPTIAELETQLEKSLENFSPQEPSSQSPRKKTTIAKLPSAKTPKKRPPKKDGKVL